MGPLQEQAPEQAKTCVKKTEAEEKNTFEQWAHTFFLTRGGCVLPGLGIGVVCGCGRGRRVSLAIMSWQTWGCAVVGARKLVPRKWPIRLGWILKSGESSSQSPPLQVLVVQSQGLGRGKTRTEKQDPPEKKWLKMLTSEQLVVVIRKFRGVLTSVI